MLDFGFQWHVTDRCNMRCAHCYQRDFSPASELPAARLLEIADRILGGPPDRSFAVNVTGGEPFLYPGLPRLLRHLDGFDNLRELNVITNGTVVGEEALAVLGESAKPGALRISVESHDPAANDRIRGDGSLARALGNLPALAEKSGRDVILMATLARHNVGHVRGIVALAREVGAAGVMFERFVPLGTGAALLDEALTPALWERAVESIVEAAGLDVPASELSRYTAFEVMTDGKDDVLKGAECELGRGSMALMPGGDVHPCRRLPIRVGNIRVDSFDEILGRLEGWRPLAGGDPRFLGCRALASCRPCTAPAAPG
jgi:MoaA/NifB/PqqE/SkfB family radical SAM enzyme